MKAEWTLAELAEESGLPARTIRYYISRGLLPGPDVAGRGAVYGPRHRDRLREIQQLQREGRMLAEIAHETEAVELPAPSPCWNYELAEGVTVQVRGDLPPWRLKLIRKVLAGIAGQLK